MFKKLKSMFSKPRTTSMEFNLLKRSVVLYKSGISRSLEYYRNNNDNVRLRDGVMR